MGCALCKSLSQKTMNSMKPKESAVITTGEQILTYRVNKQIIKIKVMPDVH